MLKRFEDEDTDYGRESRGADCSKALRAAENKKKNCGGIPNPAVAETRGGNHPEADPTRRTPAIEPAHHAVIAVLDETPEIAGYGHL
jgi:hypothetical protein